MQKNENSVKITNTEIVRTTDFSVFRRLLALNYHFFDYKYNISGFESDLFSTSHLVFIVLVYVLGVVLSIVLRNAKRRNIDIFLKVFAVIAVVFEITKILWESYYDITTDRGFNYSGIIPIYTCSLFIYTMIFAAFGKGKVKEIALSFLTTISLLFGAIGVVYCNGLNWYPFWTFGAFYSLFFHSSMFVVGIYLWISGYKKPTWDTVWQSFIPIVLLALVAIPVNYSIGSDYMLLYSGGGVPLYEDLASALAASGWRPVYTIIMLLTHLPLSAMIVGIVKLIYFIFAAKKPKEQI